MTTTDHPAQRVDDTTGSGAFRPDIEGMRAVAVAFVMLYHAGIPWFSGGYIGVDVFFVISGFLITGLLVRELEASHHIDLARFYARRVRRLLPAAALVLATVAALTIVALPATRWLNVGRDIQWSALYAVNWRFAHRAVDYLAAGEAASPVQHFWSLAVEEQFYVVWPLLLLALALAVRRRSWSLRSGMVVGMLAVGVPSLWWSMTLTAAEPGRAFFVSTTRVWELAIGGGLAILTPQIRRLPARATPGLAIAGLAVIVWAAVTYDSFTLFPGSAALLPVLGAAGIVAAGTALPENTISRGLGIRPMRQVGAMSYSLYLWHWPLVVAADATWGPLSPVAGLAVVAGSVVPAWLGFRYVEHRWRHSDTFVSPPRRGLMIGLALTLIGVAIGSAVVANVSDDGTSSAVVIVPPPVEARDDLPVVYADGCHQSAEGSDVTTCRFGAADADIEVVLLGDSHAAQWVPTMRVVAETAGWSLTTMTKSGCEFADTLQGVGEQRLPYESCTEWNANVIAELTARPPDAVITSGIHWAVVLGDDGVLDQPAATAALTDGYVRSWSELGDAGITVIAVLDTPYPQFDVPECVAENTTALDECAFDLASAMEGNTPIPAAATRTGVPVVDLTGAICPGDTCPAVIEGVLVWRDTHHLTATYARALGPALESELRMAAPGLFDR